MQTNQKIQYNWSDELELFVIEFTDSKGESKTEESQDLSTAFVKSVRSITSDSIEFVKLLEEGNDANQQRCIRNRKIQQIGK